MLYNDVVSLNKPAQFIIVRITNWVHISAYLTIKENMNHERTQIYLQSTKIKFV